MVVRHVMAQYLDIIYCLILTGVLINIIVPALLPVVFREPAELVMVIFIAMVVMVVPVKGDKRVGMF
jgi:predicted membrane channel-forming protein YqfA (hemolysin III family)